MAEIRLYYADCAGVPGNCSYPHEAVIEDTVSLRRAVSRDYVCVAYKTAIARTPISEPQTVWAWIVITIIRTIQRIGLRRNMCAGLSRIPPSPCISAGTT